MKTLAFVFLAVVAPSLFAREAVSANDQARFLAGLPVPARSTLAAAAASAAWKAHAAEMDAAWIKSESRSISKTRDWAASFVRGGGAPCYYMFSGPDILFAHTIFPGAPVYVLCGNEPIGSVPDVIGDAALASVRQSLSNVMRFSYFITKDMRADLSGSQLNGVLPIFYVLLARSGCTIQSVERMSAGAPGVRIVFRSGFGTHTMYYFQADLSNGGSGAAVMNFCRKQGRGVGLLKAASYLLHEDSFSRCRDFILTNCRVLVQDDNARR